jgi:hypothetical protein
LSDALDRGITVTELSPMGQPIDIMPETTAAFVGRALRGPLNQPVLVQSFGEFGHRFGGSWSRSSLGPAVKQFFEHGGKNLYIVRVANHARGAMVCLPASGSALVLRAVEPGSTERIRAAVDYDGIDDDSETLFNLTLQRIEPGTELVTDQEIFQRVSCRQDDEAFVGIRLAASMLARVESPLPTHRPEATSGTDRQYTRAYIEHAQSGSDGHELSDYDLVGSRREESGLFALDQVEHFDLLYLPPPGKRRDLGPASILAADRYCRKRGAMLVVDPAIDWVTPDKAVAGVRELGIGSPNMIGYFPRMYSRRNEDDAARAVGGALAGLLCKLDRNHGPWHTLDHQDLGFNRDLVAAYEIDDDDERTLSRQGLNVIAKGAVGRAVVRSSVTMGRGSEEHRMFAGLPIRRLYLHIVHAIDKGTRWAVFEKDDLRLAAQVQSQVTAYLAAMADLGALETDDFIVDCDAGVSKREDANEHGVTILLRLQPVGCTKPISFTLHQTVAGCRVTSTAFAPVI